jgi:O-antigen/teichoic acid export membrane protein
MSNSFVKNGIYNTAAGAIRILLGILTIPVLVRTLGVQEYGLWTLVSSLVGMMSLLEGGFSTTTTFFIAQDIGNKDREGLSQTITVTLLGILGLASIGGVSFWFSAESIARGFPKLDPVQYLTLLKAIQLSSVVLIFRLLQQVLIAINQGLQKYQETSVISTLQSIIQCLGYISIPYFGGRTVELMMWQLALTTAFLLIYVIFTLKFFHPWSVHYAWNNRKGFNVLKYSGSVWMSNLGGVLFSQVDKILVGYIAGTAALGVYGVITNIASQINTISAAPVQPILPMLTEYLAKNKSEQIYDQLKRAFQLNCLVAVGLGSFLMLGGEIILPLILASGIGKETLLAYQSGVFIYTIYSLNAVGYYICFAVNLVEYCMVIVMASGILSLSLINFGVEHLGILGGVIGNAGYFLSLLLVWKAMRRMNISIYHWMPWISLPVASFICLSIFTTEFHDYILIQKLGQAISLLPMILWSKQLVSVRKLN